MNVDDILTRLDRKMKDLSLEEIILDRRDSRSKIEALNARVKELEGAGWQDISTAPKDGTHVLVAFADTMTPNTVAHWFGPPPLPGLRAGAWYLSVQQMEGPSIQPTHWQPLPLSPHPHKEANNGR